MNLPRNFRLMEELDNSSKYKGISYGLQNPDDIDFIYWYGTFITATGHVINFNFICDETYPFSSPIFYFDESYLYLDIDDLDDNEFGILINKIKELCEEETIQLKSDLEPIKSWTPIKTIGSLLTEIRELIGEP